MPMPSLPEAEREVAASWARSGLAARTLAGRSARPPWSLHTPPTPASGVPGIHHVRPLAVNDVQARFRAMRGYHVRLLTGTDSHGPGVELAVAADLGLASPADIAVYGPAAFISRCEESARRHA